MNLINSFIISIYKKLLIDKLPIELVKNDETKKSDSIAIKVTKEEEKLTLVETIEELGFIPSIDENDDDAKAA